MTFEQHVFNHFTLLLKTGQCFLSKQIPKFLTWFSRQDLIWPLALSNHIPCHFFVSTASPYTISIFWMHGHGLCKYVCLEHPLLIYPIHGFASLGPLGICHGCSWYSNKSSTTHPSLPHLWVNVSSSSTVLSLPRLGGMFMYEILPTLPCRSSMGQRLWMLCSPHSQKHPDMHCCVLGTQ